MSIKIDTDALTTKITQLKEQQRIIAEVLEKFKGDTLIMDTYWSGNSGDMVKEKLTNYTTIFDLINGRLINFIVFLESVVNGYIDEENMIMNQIETNASISIGPSSTISEIQTANGSGTYITDVPSTDSDEDFEGKLNSLLENGWIVETRPPYLMQVDENGNLTHYSPNDYLLNDIGSVHEDFGVTLPPQFHEVPHQEVTIPAPDLGYHHGPQVAPNGTIYYEK